MVNVRPCRSADKIAVDRFASTRAGGAFPFPRISPCPVANQRGKIPSASAARKVFSAPNAGAFLARAVTSDWDRNGIARRATWRARRLSLRPRRNEPPRRSNWRNPRNPWLRPGSRQTSPHPLGARAPLKVELRAAGKNQTEPASNIVPYLSRRLSYPQVLPRFEASA